MIDQELETWLKGARERYIEYVLGETPREMYPTARIAEGKSFDAMIARVQDNAIKEMNDELDRTDELVDKLLDERDLVYEAVDKSRAAWPDAGNMLDALSDIKTGLGEVNDQ